MHAVWLHPQGPRPVAFLKIQHTNPSKARSRNDNSKTGTPRIHAYAHPNATAQIYAKPLSNAGPANTATTVITHPDKLSPAIVTSRRPSGFTDGDFTQISKQKIVGTESSNSTVTKSCKSTVPRIFNLVLLIQDHRPASRLTTHGMSIVYHNLRLAVRLPAGLSSVARSAKEGALAQAGGSFCRVNCRGVAAEGGASARRRDSRPKRVGNGSALRSVSRIPSSAR